MPLHLAVRRLIPTRGPESVDETLALIVAGAVASLPLVRRAGISYLERDGTVSSRAPSDAVVAELDALQNTLDQGPCLDAVRGGGPVTASDMSTSGVDRWPQFAPVAAQRGVLVACSLPLFNRHDGVVGALTLYGGHPEVVGEDGLSRAAVFASCASLALHGAHRVARMTTALANRDAIGQAKGILMERYGLSDDEAFARLVASSQHVNLKVHAVARWLIDDARGAGSRP
ncbi:ANTAR domain-containing protein [Actinomycetospora corticicola]|uniref:ANTAR domain-containing protein n=1 Tax=Actinomycetospora corticicola TaxID=663602 RepID=A0A7Y9E2J9_9PSEU|nr:hypothetical protein [Actinomycetospora corticicola]